MKSTTREFLRLSVKNLQRQLTVKIDEHVDGGRSNSIIDHFPHSLTSSPTRSHLQHGYASPCLLRPVLQFHLSVHSFFANCISARKKELTSREVNSHLKITFSVKRQHFSSRAPPPPSRKTVYEDLKSPSPCSPHF